MNEHAERNGYLIKLCRACRHFKECTNDVNCQCGHTEQCKFYATKFNIKQNGSFKFFSNTNNKKVFEISYSQGLWTTYTEDGLEKEWFNKSGDGSIFLYKNDPKTSTPYLWCRANYNRFHLNVNDIPNEIIIEVMSSVPQHIDFDSSRIYSRLNKLCRTCVHQHSCIYDYYCDCSHQPTCDFCNIKLIPKFESKTNFHLLTTTEEIVFSKIGSNFCVFKNRDQYSILEQFSMTGSGSVFIYKHMGGIISWKKSFNENIKEKYIVRINFEYRKCTHIETMSTITEKNIKKIINLQNNYFY